jgi:isocitrate/isopropylmalate dehydrogenase
MAARPWKIASKVTNFTRVGIERIMQFASETAKSRANHHFTVVTKSNSMRHGLLLRDQIAKDASRDYPKVT